MRGVAAALARRVELPPFLQWHPAAETGRHLREMLREVLPPGPAPLHPFPGPGAGPRASFQRSEFRVRTMLGSIFERGPPNGTGAMGGKNRRRSSAVRRLCEKAIYAVIRLTSPSGVGERGTCPGPGRQQPRRRPSKVPERCREHSPARHTRHPQKPFPRVHTTPAAHR